MSALLGAREVRELADRLGVAPTKSRGQNFVVDANTVRRAVELAGVRPGERVLEVGPGLGSLTLALLDAGASVVAVELDPVLAAALPDTVAARLPDAVLDVVHADALRVTDLPGEPPLRLVANLPYNVSVPVLLGLLERFPSLGSALVMVQAEVGERLAAPPGSRVYGVPSVKAAWWSDVRVAGTVSRQVFWPAPHVDSVLVSLVRHPPVGPDALRRETFRLVDAAFAQRRKTLRAALAGAYGGAPAAEAALLAAGIDPGARGETLAVADFARLAGVGAL
ncbi:MAG TPA: 16S rRNA (adenine(1518)-N(6)/adenine(1519)-N(6))-dimethyltransferase RsmA [Mycobacteriales bacterium]